MSVFGSFRSITLRRLQADCIYAAASCNAFDCDERAARVRLAPITDLPDVASPSRKNISCYQKRKSVYGWPVSPDERGVAHITNARWDAMDANCATDESA